LLKVGTVARLTGLSRQAVHQYAQLGLIRPAAMTDTRQRLFRPEVVQQVETIRKLVLVNRYSLQALRMMLRSTTGAAPDERRKEKAGSRRAEG
jgi:DNA-binding transcriptional MerR regulator